MFWRGISARAKGTIFNVVYRRLVPRLGHAQAIGRHHPVLFSEFSPNDLVRRSQMQPSEYLTELVNLGYDLFVLPITGQRSTVPQTPDEILDAYSRTRASHLDVVGYPRR